MADYALSAPDKAAMHKAFEAVGIAAEGELRTQGLFEDGTEWALLELGPRFDGDLYWIALRWNGEAPTPPLPADVTIAWAGGIDKFDDYPAGLPRFA